jgi:uncharacterized protein YdeI (YjbR/CyaY-like superfamily)
MGKRDPRIDAYIAKQKDFAKPILTHLRDVVHAACPDVEETLKWSSPFFDYKGQPMCNMAAFKEHAAFGFWKAPLIEGLGSKSDNGVAGSAGHFGRLAAVKDLPSKKVLTGYIKSAMKLNDEGVVVAKSKISEKPVGKIPPELASALAKNKKAKVAFDAFPPSHRREYVEWVADAKREETRAKRAAQAVEWIAEGKSRNWKYQ